MVKHLLSLHCSVYKHSSYVNNKRAKHRPSSAPHDLSCTVGVQEEVLSFCVLKLVKDTSKCNNEINYQTDWMADFGS